MEKINSILVIIIGILLVLPLVGVDALESAAGWAIAIIVLVIGVLGLLKKKAVDVV